MGKYSNDTSVEHWLGRGYSDEQAKLISSEGKKLKAELFVEFRPMPMGESYTRMEIVISGLRQDSYDPTPENRARAEELTARINEFLAQIDAEQG